MAYERINRPEGLLYHYTKKENAEQIIRDGKVKRFRDRETWFCSSLEDTLKLMEMTVMQEGKLYFDAVGLPKHYPPFVAEDYVILELSPKYQSGDWVMWNQEFPVGVSEEIRKLGEEFSHLKLGFRGDLKFYENPTIHEVAELLAGQSETLGMVMT